jgi:hypothetical protein
MPPKRGRTEAEAERSDAESDGGDDVADATHTTDDAAAFSADFTYPFLKGVKTIGRSRPRRIDIPKAALERMTGMERQFWEIKKEFFDVVVFFKKGKFYELYDCDAVIGNREFGLKMCQDLNNRGKMRMAGVPEQSFAEWSRLFVFKGYKVGRVEQLAVDEALIAANGGKEPKCIPRELVSILTRGTVTEASMLAGNEANYVMAFAPPASGSPHAVDAVAIDVSRRAFWHCPCADVDELAALLYQLCPTEVVLGAAQFSNGVTVDDVRRVATAVNPDCAVEELSTLPVPPRSKDEQRPQPADTTAPLGAAPTAFASPARAALGDYLRYLLQDVAQLLPAMIRATPSPTAFCPYTAHRQHSATDAGTALAALSAAPASKPLLSVERDDDAGLVMDAAAIESLELTANLRDGTKAGSFLTFLTGSGRVATAGGSRMLRQWVLRPSSNAEVLGARQQIIACFAGCKPTLAVDAARPPTGDDLCQDTTLVDVWCAALGVAQRRSASSPLAHDSPTPGAAFSPSTQQSDATGGGTPSAAKLGGRWRPMKLSSLDLERLLGRVSDIANVDMRVSFADPLVMYPKHLAALDSTLQGFTAVAELAANIAAWIQALPPAVQAAPGLRMLRELIHRASRRRTRCSAYWAPPSTAAASTAPTTASCCPRRVINARSTGRPATRSPRRRSRSTASSWSSKRRSDLLSRTATSARTCFFSRCRRSSRSAKPSPPRACPRVS